VLFVPRRTARSQQTREQRAIPEVLRVLYTFWYCRKAEMMLDSPWCAGPCPYGRSMLLLTTVPKVLLLVSAARCKRDVASATVISLSRYCTFCGSVGRGSYATGYGWLPLYLIGCGICNAALGLLLEPHISPHSPLVPCAGGGRRVERLESKRHATR